MGVREKVFIALLTTAATFAGWTTVLSTVLAPTGCSSPPAPSGADAGVPPGGLTDEQANRVLAKVGDRTITLGEFATVLEKMDQFNRLRYQSVDRRKELLNELVDIELLSLEAKKRGLDTDPATQEALRQVLRDAYLTEVHDKLPTPTEIPVEEVKAYYEAHLNEFREPERRRVSAIVLADSKRASDLLEDAKKATDSAAWSKLFFENSETAPKEHLSNQPVDLAGDLGVVGPPEDNTGGNEKVPEEVRTAAFTLKKVGEVYGQVVGDGKKFYIIRLNGIAAGHARPFSEADKGIRVILLEKRMKELEDATEEELKKKYKVELDDAALDKLSVTLPDDGADAPPQPTESAAPSASAAAGSPSAARSASAAPSSSANPPKKK